jgi:hypothetical protein
MKSALNITQKYEAGLTLELTDQQAKFRVDESVWKAGIKFVDVLAEFKSRLSAEN